MSENNSTENTLRESLRKMVLDRFYAFFCCHTVRLVQIIKKNHMHTETVNSNDTSATVMYGLLQNTRFLPHRVCIQRRIIIVLDGCHVIGNSC